MKKNPKKLALNLALLTTIISCGGGGGNSNSATSQPTPIPGGTSTNNPNNSAPSTQNSPNNTGAGNNQTNTGTNTANTNNGTTNNNGTTTTTTTIITDPNGGQVGGTRGNYISNTTITVATVPHTPKSKVENPINWNNTTITYNPNNPNNHTNKTYTGKGVNVGVIDAGFLTTDTELLEIKNTKFNNTPTLVAHNKTTSNAKHGTNVIRMLADNSGYGVAPDVQIFTADAMQQMNLTTTYNMYKNLSDSGVEIYNQSLGIAEPDNVLSFHNNLSGPRNRYYKSHFHSKVLDFYKDEVKNGKLFVWASGNDPQKTNPSLEGGLPYFEKELEKGWLNVVGLQTPNEIGQIDWDNLKVLSQAGVAKNWTVTALGEYKILDEKESTATEKVHNILLGSSFAAPKVTGTAALLKEKYPFMDGSLIRQTILSTATDIGEVGVDEKYGWGLLNIDKALNGPALFSKQLALDDNVVVNIPNGTYTFSNDISGDAGIIKNGAGTLILDGNSTFTGGTTVNDGKLKVGGTFISNLQINELGTLETSENASLSNVTANNGTIINNSKDTVINGNLSTNDTKIISDVSSKLTIFGNADLKNTELELTSKDENGNAKYITANGVENEIILATGGINGDISGIKSESLLNALVENDGNVITAKLNRKDVEEYVKSIDVSGKDEIWKNVAQNLETSFDELDNKIQNGNANDVTQFANAAAQIQTMSTDTASPILDSLSGQIFASAQALTFQQSQTVNKDLSNRLTMLGTLENTGEKAGLWVTGMTANGHLRQEGYGVGKTKVNGGQVGVDKKITDNLIVGLAGSYSVANAEFDRYGGKSDATNLGISAYGRYGNKENPFYVQGRIGAGFVNSEVERDIILSKDNSSRAKIEHKDKVYSGYLETGYDFKKNNFVLTPFVGVSYDMVERGAFTEENSQFGLTADKAKYSQTSGLVGLRVGQGFNWGNGSKTTLQGYLTHQSAFNDEDLSFNAAYNGLSDAKFKVKGIGLTKDRTWAGIGVLNEINPAFAWYVNYDAKIEKGKVDNNVFSTGFRFNFN